MKDLLALHAKLKELAGKATPGPWEIDTYMPTQQAEVSIQIVSPGTPGLLLFESSNADTRMTDYDVDEHGATYFDIGSRPNYELVCELRNNLPTLLAALEEVEAGRHRKHISENPDPSWDIETHAAHIDKAERELKAARLRTDSARVLARQPAGEKPAYLERASLHRLRTKDWYHRLSRDEQNDLLDILSTSEPHR